MPVRIVLCAAVLAGLAGCASNYSPNTYSSTAVQQANPVDQGVVVGAREVGVSADTTVGAVTGAAAGGVAGSQVGGGVTSAFGAIGGGLLGGLAGSAAQHVEGDAQAYEYIVRKKNGDLISVTQQDTQELRIGEHVLVIAGKQARIVADYTVPVDEPKTQIVVAVPPVVPVPSAPTTDVPPVPAPPVVVPAETGPSPAAPQTAPTPLTPPPSTPPPSMPPPSMPPSSMPPPSTPQATSPVASSATPDPAAPAPPASKP